MEVTLLKLYSGPHDVIKDLTWDTSYTKDFLKKKIKGFDSSSYNSPNEEGDFPLHCAVKNRQMGALIIPILMECSVDVNARNSSKQTALRLALELKHYHLVDIILQYEPDVLDIDDCSTLAASLGENKIQVKLESVRDMFIFAEKNGFGSYKKKFYQHGITVSFLREIKNNMPMINHVEKLLKMSPDVDLIAAIKMIDPLIQLEPKAFPPLLSSLPKEIMSRVLNFMDVHDIRVLSEVCIWCNNIIDWELIYFSRIKYYPYKGLSSWKYLCIQNFFLSSDLNNRPSTRIAPESLVFLSEITPLVFIAKLKREKVAIKIRTEVVDTNDFKERNIMTWNHKHSHIASLRGFFAVKKDFAVAVTYCENGSLYDIMNNHPFVFDWPTVFRFSRQAAVALYFLHNQRLSHKELESKHILVTRNWDIKLSCPCTQFLAPSNVVHVPILYASPELYHGHPHHSTSDIYALGIILWEITNVCLTGKYLRPYQESSDAREVFWQTIVENRRPSKIAGCPEPWWDLISNMWSIEINQRGSAKHVWLTVENFEKEYRKSPTSWDTPRIEKYTY